MNICGIRFKDTGKVYYFRNDGLDLKINLTVVVDTEKGEQFAKVVEVNVSNVKNLNVDNMKKVLRISTKDDYNRYMKNLKDAASALNFAKKLLKKKVLK